MPATSQFRARLLDVYKQVRPPTMAMSEMFTVRPRNISDTEVVAIDIVREDEQISPVVNTCEGPTFNVADQFTTKEFTPPSLNEAMPFSCKELLNRRPGETQFDATDVGFQTQFVEALLDGMESLENKMRRNREWQASQILQTGILNLKDENGNVNYTIDFLAKADHFPDAAATWSASADILADLESLADVIRDSSLQDADEIWLGANALGFFLQNTEIQAQLDNRRMEIGQIRPGLLNSGAKFIGTIHVGAYEFNILTYNGRGIEPGALPSAKFRFLGADNCIMRASTGRLDTVFAGVPMPVNRDPRFEGILPDRISVPMAVDIAPVVYATPDGKQTILGLESRPLLIPTDIDSFGTIDTAP